MHWTREFHGPNLAYAAELYRRYRENPAAVDDGARELFDDAAPPAERFVGLAPTRRSRILAAAEYVRALRTLGHRGARLDPLGGDPPADPALRLDTHGLREDDLAALPAAIAGGPAAEGASDLGAAVEELHAIYLATTGYDFAHVHEPEERTWLRDAVEDGRFRPPAEPIDEEALLARLTAVEAFERFLHRLFPGRTRFSLEGLDVLVPVLDELARLGTGAGARALLLGMPHRGRLNVLAHVLERGVAPILADFKHDARAHAFRDHLGWSGDVAYHQGARRDPADAPLVIHLPPNPSHVELIDPVVLGMARAAGTRTDAAGAPRFDPARVLPVLVHGDASFPGEGVVAETLNFAALDGYTVGGTLHVIADNQLGYTTEPEEGRSTRYASDLAAGFRIPVVHVNADDPVACVAAARLAFAYRARFRRDFVLHLVGYRRHGHNEGDEPSFTQPLLYARVRSHPSVRARYAEELAARDAVSAARADELEKEARRRLQEALDELEPPAEQRPPEERGPEPAEKPATGVDLERLRAFNRELMRDPEDFAVHPKLAKARERRRRVLDAEQEASVDWATAEELAFASVLADGIAVRLTGEDAARGTFNQRHAVLVDVETGRRLVPLQRLEAARAAFEVRNSPLTENAAVGFEYGYDVEAGGGTLVLWEAQYGDFANNAQPVIDELLVSGRVKWRQRSALVLLLPHGYEGQGPDHSSARLERFLSLAAEGALRVAQPSRAAQYFHLLRRQAALLEEAPVPLVVLTPKSLLRHPRMASRPLDFAAGGWEPVRGDPEERQDAARLVLCSGKVGFDLLESDARGEDEGAVAVARLDQLFPFPEAAVAELLERHADADEIAWVQEEPENQGAWPFVRERLAGLADGRALRYVGRTRSASPAEGAARWHEENQASIVALAFDREAEPAPGGMVVSRRLA